MALKNIKNHGCGAVTRDGGILTTDQVQIVTRAAVPTDSTLANGRLVYVTGTGFRGYAEGAWFTIPTSTSGGSAGSWDTLYASDKSLTIDSTTLTLAGTHATNAVVTITGSGSGAALQITNSSTGADISGTSATWSVSAAGAAVFTAVTGCDTLTAAGNLAIDANGTGTITLGATSTGAITLTRAVTATASITITGTANTGVFTITAGDTTISDGSITLTDADDAASLTLINNSCAAGNLVDINADGITSGYALHIDSNNGGSFSTGGYFEVFDGSASCFTIKRYGATIIAGNAATNVFTITAGHAVVTSGNLTLTAGNLVMTSGSFTYTAGDMTMSDGSIAVTDADDNNSFALVNNTAVGTNAAVVSLAGSGTYTGSTTKSFMTITPSGLTTGTGVYLPLAALTEGKGLHITSDVELTTGSLLYVQNTGANVAMTSGTVATFDHTATAIASSVNKIGSVVSVTSNRTVNTGGTTADDFDLLSCIKTTTRTAGTAATTGSVLYVGLVSTGTVTETSKGIEVVMDSGGTGDGIEITHAATGGVALDVIGAATSVSDVLITGSGVKATGKAVLEVASTGSTAAGGRMILFSEGFKNRGIVIAAITPTPDIRK